MSKVCVTVCFCFFFFFGWKSRSTAAILMRFSLAISERSHNSNWWFYFSKVHETQKEGQLFIANIWAFKNKTDCIKLLKYRPRLFVSNQNNYNDIGISYSSEQTLAALIYTLIETVYIVPPPDNPEKESKQKWSGSKFSLSPSVCLCVCVGVARQT